MYAFQLFRKWYLSELKSKFYVFVCNTNQFIHYHHPSGKQIVSNGSHGILNHPDGKQSVNPQWNNYKQKCADQSVPGELVKQNLTKPVLGI